jgi:hypothetical protein
MTVHLLSFQVERLPAREVDKDMGKLKLSAIETEPLYTAPSHLA